MGCEWNTRRRMKEECRRQRRRLRVISTVLIYRDGRVAKIFARESPGWPTRRITAAEVQGLREGYTRSIEPARARAVETLNLERTLSDIVNQAYALTPAKIVLMWQSAPPRRPIPAP